MVSVLVQKRLGKCWTAHLGPHHPAILRHQYRRSLEGPAKAAEYEFVWNGLGMPVN
jgi:hypothetical protein